MGCSFCAPMRAMADKRDGGMAFVKNGGVVAVVWPTQAEPVLLPPWDGRTCSRSSGADVLERIRPGGTGRGVGQGGERGGSGESGSRNLCSCHRASWPCFVAGLGASNRRRFVPRVRAVLRS